MKLRITCVALLFLSVVLSLTAQTTNSKAVATTTQVPRLVRFGGTLKDVNADAVNSVVGVTFSLYAEPTGGAPLWSEVQNVQLDSSGRYSVLLGSTKPDGLPVELFTSAEAQWLGVQQQGQPELPRIMLLSVPYALKAADAETFGGKPPSAYVSASAAETNSTSSTSSTAVGSSGSQNHNAPHPLPISGSGTTNYVPLWTSASNLASSGIFQSGSFLGIGTTTPVAPLTVINSTSTNPAAILGSSNGPTTTGIVGGNTSTTGSPIGVQGTVNAAGGVGVEGTNNSANGTGPGVLGIGPMIGVSGNADGKTGQTFGVMGAANSPSGVGVYGDATATSGNTVGVSGLSSSTSGIGVAGGASATTGNTVGVSGLSNSTSGIGVSGTASATTGQTVGVEGSTSSTSGIGVSGVASATTGVTIATSGTNSSTEGIGVVGDASATTGNTIGVKGTTSSTSGTGVSGDASATTGTAVGVSGESSSTDGVGVVGDVSATTGNTYGVAGHSASSSGYGVYGVATSTTGATNGVHGESDSKNGFGVYGIATSTDTSGLSVGVYGQSANGVGVSGYSTANSGVVGVSNGNGSCCTQGAAGINMATSGFSNGVYGEAHSPDGVGGLFENQGGGYILIARVDPSTNRFTVDNAGNGVLAAALQVGGNGSFGGTLQVNGNGTFGPTQINGNLNVTGTLTKGGGSFKIDDPLDPENKYLSHSFVESPDMMNIYNGNVITDKRGLAIVVLPNYFEALNRDFRYQLTVIGQFAQAIVAKEINQGRFTIRTNKPGVKVSWQVTGIRHDAWANAHRIPTEEEKPAQERGTYLHPELYGASAEKNTNAMLQH